MICLLETMGELLRYPDERYAGLLDEAVRLSRDECRAALARLREQTSVLCLSELQGLYTKTFDLSPLCSLEAGWHLYGEDYARGSFLAYMRSVLAAHGVPERGELADHLANVLPAIARMPAAGADELRQGAALPAVRKMLKVFERQANPFGDLLRALAILLEMPASKPEEEPSHV
ncbi:MAG: molecular chaperone TorD family protein [Bryobacterales bacterium]|nr:molecular chaperone TorD family protein [Bryobacterales bacterium]